MIRIYATLICFMAYISMSSQEGIQLNTPDAYNGYLLYENNPGFSSPEISSTYLVNNCGEIVHEWSEIGDTELHAKLQVDGTLTYISNDEKTLIVRNWDNSIRYSYTIQDNALNIVYEAILMPNGHYLCLTRRYLSEQEFINIGYHPSFAGPAQRIDGVIEIDPDVNQIVWEWNIMDHVIQQRDVNAPNYGILRDNPQLMDMDALIESYDWQFGESFMINGFDYNPELDQIALSVRKMGEVAIIDHSTTTAEARGSIGGNSGKGGDFIYRFGNPQNYDRGTADDRILYYQHNPNWIKYGPHAGKLICFNNGLNRPDVTNFDDQYSSVPIFDPIEEGATYFLEDGEAYGPLEPEVNYDKFDSNTFFFSGYTSAAQVLPNGNIMITEGVDGRILEIDNTGNKVWEYVADGYDGGGYIFRSERYGADYPALIDKDLTPTGSTVEFPSSSYNCTLYITSSENLQHDPKVSVLNLNESLSIETDLKDFNLRIFDAIGRNLISSRGTNNSSVNIAHLQPGAYFVQLNSIDMAYMKTWKFIKN